MANSNRSEGAEECHDLSLMRRVATQNDHAAWDELQVSLSTWFEKFCQSLCWQYSVFGYFEQLYEDSVIDFIRRIEKQPDFMRSRSCGAVCSYLKTIARNKARKFKEAEQKKAAAHREFYYSRSSLNFLECDEGEDHEAQSKLSVYRLLMSLLPTKDHELLLRWVDGERIRDLAEWYGKKPRALEKHIERLLDELTMFAERLGY